MFLLSSFFPVCAKPTEYCYGSIYEDTMVGWGIDSRLEKSVYIQFKKICAPFSQQKIIKLGNDLDVERIIKVHWMFFVNCGCTMNRYFYACLFLRKVLK